MKWLEDYRRLRTSSKVRVVKIAQSTLDCACDPDQHQKNNDKLETEMLRDDIKLSDKVREVKFVQNWLSSFEHCEEVLAHVKG